MEPLSVTTLVLLALAGLAAGFVDAIAGGGGMITIPALFAAGLPPHLALGTNKLQATFGSGMASLRFARDGLLPWRSVRVAVACTALGAWAGTTAVQHLSAVFLQRAIPVLLAAVLIYTLIHPRFGGGAGRARLAPMLFQVLTGLALGFYDGFFGPGTGSFWAFAWVVGAGLDLTRATGHAKLMNFTSNVVSLAAFLAAGQVMWVPGLAMGAGQAVGAWLGAHTALKRGAGFIRAVFLIVVAGTIVWLLVR